MPKNDPEEPARDLFEDLGQDFAALIRRLNAENVKGRGELAENLRVQIEESRQATREGREELAKALRAEIEESRNANSKGREELAKALRAEVEESRKANSKGREELAKALRTEIGQARTGAVEDSKAALSALLPGLLWKLLGGVAAMLAVAEFLGSVAS